MNEESAVRATNTEQISGIQGVRETPSPYWMTAEDFAKLASQDVPDPKVYPLHFAESYAGHVLAGYKKKVAAESKGNAQGWISVEDRFPELEDHMGSMESALLLFRYGSGTPHIGWMTADKRWIDYWSNSKTGSVTHWMKFDEHAPAAPERPMQTGVIRCDKCGGYLPRKDGE